MFAPIALGYLLAQPSRDQLSGDRRELGALTGGIHGAADAQARERPRFALTGSEPAVVLITGTGPTDTMHENPADNPTRKPLIRHSVDVASSTVAKGQE